MIHPTYVRLLCMQLRSLRVDVDAVLAAGGLRWEQLASDNRRLTLASVARIGEAALHATGRPWLGLEVGAAAQISSHGALGYAEAASRDLRQCLQTLARFASLRNATMSWDYSAEAGGAVLVAREEVPLGPTRQFILDVVFATVLRLIENVTGEPAESVAVDLPFAAPPWRERYERCGTRALRFGQPVLAFHVPEALLATLCPTADAKAHEMACRECEQELAEQHSASIAPRVRAVLQAVSGSAYPSLPDVAAQLGVSARTLMRRLQGEGTSYQALLDDARKKLAVWYLQHTGRAVEDIAARLGYADPSNFSRTFRRWFGITPAAMRAQRSAQIAGVAQ
ncbi:MAG TPA: AraC family transcriptional regulator [Albitalea sp.]|nr:AraC family transcriptional regulator [Albitalea sp.]